jgi:hypothetical protein
VDSSDTAAKRWRKDRMGREECGECEETERDEGAKLKGRMGKTVTATDRGNVRTEASMGCGGNDTVDTVNKLKGGLIDETDGEEKWTMR